MLNTIIGREFSLQRVIAVISITRRLLVKTSLKRIESNFTASGYFMGSLSYIPSTFVPFNTISAFASHAAMPHYSVTKESNLSFAENNNKFHHTVLTKTLYEKAKQEIKEIHEI